MGSLASWSSAHLTLLNYSLRLKLERVESRLLSEVNYNVETALGEEQLRQSQSDNKMLSQRGEMYHRPRPLRNYKLCTSM